jgi:hypothetical protein
MSAAPEELEKRASFWLALVLLLACAGVAWAIWSVPLVMTNDGPEALLTAHMEAHYDDPGSIFQQQYGVGFGLSGRGFSVLYRPLAAVFSFTTSLRIAELVMVLLLALAFAWLARGLANERGPRFAGLLGFAIAFSWPFYMGFFAFTLSMGFGLLILAFVVNRPRGLTLIDKAAVSTALLVQLFFHGFAVFITLSLITLVVMTRMLMARKEAAPAEWRRQTLGTAAWLAVSALPSVVVLLIMRTAQKAMSSLSGSEATEWAKPADWARILPRLAVPGSTALGIAVLVLAVVAIVRTALRIRRGPRRADEVALLIGAVGLLLAGIAMPLNLPGWQFFAPRFLTTGLALSLCLHANEPFTREKARSAFDAAVIALVAMGVLNARALNRRLATACDDAVIGLEHRIPRKGFQLPIDLNADCGLSTEDTRIDVPYMTPLLHFGSLFPVVDGGTTPYGFFGPAAVHAFVPREVLPVPVPPILRYWGLSGDDPRIATPKLRTGVLTDLAAFGTYYENVLVFGATASDRSLLLDRGYVIDFEHGSFINAHAEPCAVELLVPMRPDDPPVLIRGGVRGEGLWSAKITPIPDDHALRASMRTLCGDVWVHVQWQNSELRCTNGDRHGRIALHAVSGGVSRVTCERGALP